MSTTNDAPDRASPFGIEQTAPEQIGDVSAHCAPASGSVHHCKDLRFYEVKPIHRETFLWVDATPDEDYPLRILRAYLDSTNVRTESNPPQLGELMNQAQDERAAILRRAIAKLTDSPNASS